MGSPSRAAIMPRAGEDNYIVMGTKSIPTQDAAVESQKYAENPNEEGREDKEESQFQIPELNVSNVELCNQIQRGVSMIPRSRTML